MTIEERVERLEHYSAAFMEERRREREEDRQIWRDTQRQIVDTQRQINELSVRTLQMGDELREAITALAAETREADKLLGQRIDALVAAIGQLIARMDIPPRPGPL